MEIEGCDPRGQREVLALVLAEDPPRLALSELEARLGGQAAVEQAVEALIAGELLVRDGDEAVPTPAAIRFHELRPITLAQDG